MGRGASFLDVVTMLVCVDGVNLCHGVRLPYRSMSDIQNPSN